MKADRSWGRTVVAAVAAAGLSMLVTSAVVGAQSSSGVIHACADARGVLRMIPANGTCMASETAVNWNIQGVAGLNGATGKKGPAGPAGPRGKKGTLAVKVPGGTSKVKLEGLLTLEQKLLIKVLGRLKKLDKKVGNVAKLDRRTYLRTYENCIGIHFVLAIQRHIGPDLAFQECLQGYYEHTSNLYKPDKAWPGFQP